MSLGPNGRYTDANVCASDHTCIPTTELLCVNTQSHDAHYPSHEHVETLSMLKPPPREVGLNTDIEGV
eukprot:402647-Pyramimonas_sp.AAC.1